MKNLFIYPALAFGSLQAAVHVDFNSILQDARAHDNQKMAAEITTFMSELDANDEEQTIQALNYLAAIYPDDVKESSLIAWFEGIEKSGEKNVWRYIHTFQTLAWHKSTIAFEWLRTRPWLTPEEHAFVESLRPNNKP